MKLGSNIKFRYKGGRRVSGTITSLDEKTVVVQLDNDYIGKNDIWYAGEEKGFNRSEMKKIVVQ
jgi:hypothetical protein